MSFANGFPKSNIIHRSTRRSGDHTHTDRDFGMPDVRSHVDRARSDIRKTRESSICFAAGAAVSALGYPMIPVALGVAGAAGASGAHQLGVISIQQARQVKYCGLAGMAGATLFAASPSAAGPAVVALLATKGAVDAAHLVYAKIQDVKEHLD